MDTITAKDNIIPPDAEFSSITVPTLDTARYSSMLSMLLAKNLPVMYVGPTGTGKTVYVQKLLLNLPATEWTSIFINFSAQTSVNQTQDILDAKLDKRRKGVFGPPLGKKGVYDEAAMRLAGLRFGVPCITTLRAAHAVVAALRSVKAGELRAVKLQELG